MAAPVGVWNINANGFKGTLNINADAQGFLSGTIDIDIGFTDTLEGVWSEAAQEITFYRSANRDDTTFKQLYKGYLYFTKEPIFAGQNPPEPNPSFRLLTGFFEAIGSGASPGRPRFGWVARQGI